MTVLDDAERAPVRRFVELLLSMSFDDPAVRPLLQLEGLTEWRPGRTSGYGQLEDYELPEAEIQRALRAIESLPKPAAVTA